MAKFLGVMTDEPQLKSIKVGDVGATQITLMAKVAITITPTSVTAATTSSQSFAVPGARVGDSVSVTPPAIVAGVAPVCARVNANDSITITFMNATAGDLVPSAGAYQVFLAR